MRSLPDVLSKMATSDHYTLLDNMNKLTSLNHLERNDIAVNTSGNLWGVSRNRKHAGLQPYLDEVTVVGELAAALSRQLTSWMHTQKNLEAKDKELEKE
uniref:Uncharacterized protein n=1 Tax=Prolemur simus TaxID=1328070 RepID=A0A8C8ZSQ9_PROSS